MRKAFAVLFAALGAAACSSSPVSPVGGVSFTAASLIAPVSGANIPNASQPITLTVTNALIQSPAAAVTYTFEVGTDPALATHVFAKDVAQGTGGVTSVQIDVLPAGTTYYWHSRTNVGGTAGVFTTPSTFTVGPAVTVSAPAPVQPLTGGVAVGQRPTLTVTNAAHTGPVGVISYRFEIATTSTFATIVQSGTVAEGSGQTSFTPAQDLAAANTYYWRAQAVDAASGIASAYSSVQSFTTQLTIDLTRVNYQRFPNVSGWPITDQIISVEQDGAEPGPMCIDHTKRYTWPETVFFGDPTVTVVANQWYLANIGGQWYAGAGEWNRPGQICKSGQTTIGIGPDGGWGGPMLNWQPRVGELVGYMMTTPARNYPDMRTLDERSNVVLQPWKDSSVSGASSIRK